MGSPVEELDDAALFALVQARDANAFRVLYERYRVRLIRFGYRYVHSVSAAEDLVQRVFTRIWCRQTVWDVRTTVQAYLFHAVRHEAGKQSEKADWEVGFAEAGHDARIGLVPRGEGAPQPVGRAREPVEPTTANDGEAIVLVEELARLYLEAVEGLPEPSRSIYRMARNQRMSYEDISRELGMTPSRVRKRIMAVHRILDARLTKAGWPGLVLQAGILGARTGWSRRQVGGGRDG